MTPKPSKDLGVNVGAYVLNALSAEENVQFEAFLAESEETRAEITELADTAVELGLSVTPIDPPASLRASILDAIATTPQLEPLPAAAEAGEGDPAIAAAPLTTAPVVNLAEERARRRWYSRPVTTLVAAAAAVALLFGGGVAVNAVIKGQQLSATASSITQIQAASDFQRRTVDVSTGGQATVIWSVSLQRSALLATDLAAPPSGKTYELWYIGTNGPTAAGTFDPTGSKTMSVMLTGKMAQGDTIGLTIEPAGGSQKPTTKPIAVVTTA